MTSTTIVNIQKFISDELPKMDEISEILSDTKQLFAGLKTYLKNTKKLNKEEIAQIRNTVRFMGNIMPTIGSGWENTRDPLEIEKVPGVKTDKISSACLKLAKIISEYSRVNNLDELTPYLNSLEEKFGIKISINPNHKNFENTRYQQDIIDTINKLYLNLGENTTERGNIENEIKANYLNTNPELAEILSPTYGLFLVKLAAKYKEAKGNRDKVDEIIEMRTDTAEAIISTIPQIKHV